MRLLERSSGDVPVTSAQIQALTGWASHTVRKDISFLSGGKAEEGGVGVESIGSSEGYAPEALAARIKQALGLEKRRKYCVVGLGRLGSAFLDVQEFGESEFELAAGFDTNVNRTEILKSAAPLYPAYKMAEVISRFGIEIALLCVPAAAAQSSAERLAAAGIRGVLNFAPVLVTIPAGVAVRNVYLADELRALSIKIGDSDHSQSEKKNE